MALPGPQPSPALGASFLSGFLQEPEPEEPAAGFSESAQTVVRLVVSFRTDGASHSRATAVPRGALPAQRKELQGALEPPCPARPPAGSSKRPPPNMCYSSCEIIDAVYSVSQARMSLVRLTGGTGQGKSAAIRLPAGHMRPGGQTPGSRGVCLTWPSFPLCSGIP